MGEAPAPSDTPPLTSTFSPPPTQHSPLAFATVVANAPIVLWAVDRDGVFTLSEGCEPAALGLRPGTSVFEVYAEYPEILDAVRQALSGREFRQAHEFNGAVFESWYSPICNDAGEVAGVISVSTDITDRVTAERERRTSDELFVTAFHASPVAIMISRLEDGVFLDVNSSFLSMAGLERSQVIGRTAVELELWNDPDERESMLAELRQRGSICGREYQFRNQVGELRIGRVFAEMVEIGGVPCLLTAAEDVTSQIQTLKALRESRERYRTLTRVAPVGIFHADAAGNYLFVNEQWCQMTGGTRKGAVGDGWAAFVHRDDRDEVFRLWNDAITHGTGFRCEYRFAPPGREAVWVLGQAEAERDDEGRVNSYVGTVTDISSRRQNEERLRLTNEELEQHVRQRTQELTRANEQLREEIRERKRVAGALRDSEEKWRSLVENAPDFILNVDLEGTIRFINRANPPLTVEAVTGTSVYDYTLPENHEAARSAFEKVLATGEPVSLEVRGITAAKDGGIAWYENHISPIKRQGKVTGFTVVTSDITPRKLLEEEARKRQAQLEHVSRVASAGHMASELAHELNQPLGAIANYATGCALRLESGRFSKSELMEVAREVAEQALRASETIRRLRAFVQKREARLEPTRLNDAIGDALAIIGPDAERRKMEVESQLADPSPMVLADGVHIMHVLVNLLANAMDAMAGNRADDRLVTVRSALFDETTALVQVVDGGTGIAEADRGRIFEPYQSTKPDGLGIGLAISRSMIETHRGQLWHSANAGAGTTFQFTLPLSRDEGGYAG